jgi:GNAT superfamily N-acetyltransferase
MAGESPSAFLQNKHIPSGERRLSGVFGGGGNFGPGAMVFLQLNCLYSFFSDNPQVPLMTSSDDIVYRTYQPGDDAQMADLFNAAFQMNGGGVVRTPKSWHWRYIEGPESFPEGIKLAECRGRIVGSVIAGVTRATFFGQEYKMGTINDVATDPKFVGRGIAKVLLRDALQCLEDQQVDYGTLDADPNGHPRSKLYIPSGFDDYQKTMTIIKVVKSRQLVRDNPLFLAAFPMTYSLAHFRQRFYPRFHSGRFEIDVVHNKRYPAYRDAFNNALQQFYEGYRIFTPERWEWARENVPSPRYRPSFAVVKEGRKIVAGISLVKLNLYAFKYGFKVALGSIQDEFVDKSAALTPEELEEIHDLLLRATHKAAADRNCGLLIGNLSPADKLLAMACRRCGWFVITMGGVHMFKPMGVPDKIPPARKPLYIFPEDSFSGNP